MTIWFLRSVWQQFQQAKPPINLILRKPLKTAVSKDEALAHPPPYWRMLATGEAHAIMSTFLQWFFRNRKTGEITIAQAPNLALWVVIVAGVLRWIWHPSGTAAVALDVAFKGGLIVWSLDEIFRGVNPWRRCLGAGVLAYELATLL